ncbi:MAG TPA: hypothetical protein VM537_37305 [Anaerolineae bacterium]|nr:hypothetical protein [Anaerolineae bacterium]
MHEGYLVRTGSTTRAHWTVGSALPDHDVLPTPQALQAHLRGDDAHD